MKKIIAVCTALAVLLLSLCTVQAAEISVTNAEAFVLYCVENGEVVLAKDANKRMQPASTTKLMTGLLTLEEAAKNDRVITFTQDMTAEGSSMYLKLGEKLRLSDLATGMMLCSGNDAANAAALSLAGDFKGFANLMNTRAKQIGMEHTHFVTPSGLHDAEHYTTAYDMALLMAEGLRNEAFANLTFQKTATVRFVHPSDKSVTYSNHNRLLRQYPDCIGGKTGYTSEAGRCLVSAARRDNVTLICVTLNDKTDWDDHAALYDAGFAQLSGYRSSDGSFCVDVPCVGGEQSTVAVMGARDVALVTESGKAEIIQRKIYLDAFVYAPVQAGDTLGHIDYVLDGKVLDSVPLTAAEDVAAHTVRKNLFEKLKEFFTYG